METRYIDELKEFEKNPRKILDDDFHKLCENLLKYGFLDPIVVDQNNVVIGGNQRLEAAKYLIGQGYKDFQNIPVYTITIESDQDRAKISMILNNHAGSWDFDKIAVLLDEYDIGVSELPELGFDIDSIESAFGIDSETVYDTSINIEDGEKTTGLKGKKLVCPRCGFEVLE